MYRLKLNRKTTDDLPPEARNAKETALQRLRDSTEGLIFDPVPHTYTFFGEQIRGVSSIVEEFAPFDTEACAKGVSRNPKHEFFGMKVDEILRIWAEKRDRAAAAGTAVHEFGEACFLLKSGQTKLPDNIPAGRLTEEGLEASSPKEEAAARFWNSLDTDRFIPVAKETTVFNPELRYAGTFDLLLYDLLEHHYVMKDYKTNENLFKWYGGHLRAPLTQIKDDDHGKYTLQQNLYRLQLENLGLHVGRMDLVWLKDTGEFEEVPIPERGRAVNYAMTTLLTNKQKN